MGYVFQFISMAFPKAGILIGTVPITVSTVLFIVTIFLVREQIWIALLKIRGLVQLYVIFCIFAVLIMALNKFNSSFYITSTLVLIASPLAIGIGFAVNPQVAVRILMASLIVVGLYAFLQWVIGINETTIQGITVALGDSLDTKPIGYGLTDIEALKMPTTYQNGNGAGIFYLMALPITLTFKTISVPDRILKVAALVAGVAGLILCGSRSAIIPFLIILPLLLIYLGRKLPYRIQLAYYSIILSLVVLTVAYFAFSRSGIMSYVWQRYFMQTVQDPSATGRTTQYGLFYSAIYGLGSTQYIQFLIRGLSWSNITYVEGIMMVLIMYGLPALISFCMILIMPVIKLFRISKPAALGLIAVLIAFCIDNSFIYPPSLINFYFIVGLILKSGTKLQPTNNPEMAQEQKTFKKEIIYGVFKK
jgi:hypothetical protein